MRVVLVLSLAMIASCKLRTLTSLVAFEGEIDMAMSTSIMPSSSTSKFEMKGHKMRTEMAGLATFVSITDADAKKTWVLDKTSRTYSEIDSSKSSPSTTTSKVIKKGSDKVAGYSCDVYEVADVTSRTEVCVASGLSLMAMGLGGPFSSFSTGDDAWGEVLSHGFPLRVVMRDPSGAPVVKIEATRIEKKSVPDSDFAIPAGYTKTASPI